MCIKHDTVVRVPSFVTSGTTPELETTTILHRGEDFCVNTCVYRRQVMGQQDLLQKPAEEICVLHRNSKEL